MGLVKRFYAMGKEISEISTELDLEESLVKVWLS